MAQATLGKWKRLDLTAIVSETIKAREDDEIIINEGYVGISGTQRTEILSLKCSGKLCVDSDDPLHRCAFVAEPEGHDGPSSTSCKFIMYELEIPNQPRDRVQPRIILLQIQMESLDHYFLHWNWPGPAVMCQQLQKYDSNGPKIDINDSSDQKFVWVIPVDTDESNELSLKPYEESYYLTCTATGKAKLCEGGKGDLKEYNTFKLRIV